MPVDFQHDGFLSPSTKDKQAVPVPNRVRLLADRFRADGLKVWLVPPKLPVVGGFENWVLRPGDSIPAQSDPPSLQSYGRTRQGLEHSRVLACRGTAQERTWILCMSAEALGSDWAQLPCSAKDAKPRWRAGRCGNGDPRFRDSLNRDRGFTPSRPHSPALRSSTSSRPGRR